MSSRKLIVGCGYLGYRAAIAWRDAGDTVFALTRSPERAKAFHAAGLVPIVGDILNPDSLRQLPEAETLLHAVGFDRASGATHRDVSCGGLSHVLQQVAPRVGRMIFISSSSVYGQTSGEWIDEDSPCEPVRENGRICLDAERLVRAAGESGLAAQILRLSGLYGPGRLLQRVESLRQRTPISGNPDAWLNLIHVDDAVRAVLTCEQRGLAGSTWLVSDDRPLPRREYYERLAALVGAPAPLFSENDPVEGASETSATARRLPRSADDFNKRCRNTRIKTELRFELRYPTISEGLPPSLPPSEPET